MIPVLNAIRQACRNFANLFWRPQPVLPVRMPVNRTVMTAVATLVAASDNPGAERITQAAGVDADSMLRVRSLTYNAAENGATALPAETKLEAELISSASVSSPIHLANTGAGSVSAIVTAKAPPSAAAMSAPSLGPEVLEDSVLTVPAIAGAGNAARLPHAPASIPDGRLPPAIRRNSATSTAARLSFSLREDEVRQSEQRIFLEKIKKAFAERYAAASLPAPDALLTSLANKVIKYIGKEIKGRIPDEFVLKLYPLDKDFVGFNITSVSFCYRDTDQIFEACVIRFDEDAGYVRLNIMSSKDFHAAVIKDILPLPPRLNRSAHSTGTTSPVAAGAGVAIGARRRAVSLLGGAIPRSNELIRPAGLAANAGAGMPAPKSP